MSVTIFRESYLITGGGPFQYERHTPQKQREEQQVGKVAGTSLLKSSYLYIVKLSCNLLMKMFCLNKGSMECLWGSQKTASKSQKDNAHYT